MLKKVSFIASMLMLVFGLTHLPGDGGHHATRLTAVVLPTTTTAAPTTTTTTAPPPTTTTIPVTVLAHAPRNRASRTEARPAPPAAATSSSNGWPARVYPAVNCMDNGEHSVALAHACWDGLINQYPWPTTTMFNVMMCESHGNPWDTGIQTRYGRAIGLMQDMGGPYDPAENMRVAYGKYQASGLGPWVSSRNCWG